MHIVGFLLRLTDTQGSTYRTRANNGRSQLVAAPLSSQAKMHFLLAFYVTI